MTEAQFDEAIRLHSRMEQLEAVKKELNNRAKHRLCYAERCESILGTCVWSPVDENKIKYINDILNKHDTLIRQEVEDEINQIKKRIKEL